MPQGDWATWVGSVGVVATLLLTLGLIERDRRLRRTERAMRREDGLRAQAEKIAGWPESFDFAPGQRALTLSNLSDSVVYRVHVFLVTPDGEGPTSAETSAASSASTTAVDLLPPGRWRVGVSITTSAQQRVRHAVELVFTDQSGRHWIRRSNGALEGLPQGADEHFQWHTAPRFAQLHDVEDRKDVE